jgi:hypothetical protein
MAKKFNFPPPHQMQLNIQGHKLAGIHAESGVLFLNTSASSNIPKVRQPVLRSPVNFFPGKRYSGRIVVPPEVSHFDPFQMLNLHQFLVHVIHVCTCLLVLMFSTHNMTRVGLCIIRLTNQQCVASLRSCRLLPKGSCVDVCLSLTKFKS